MAYTLLGKTGRWAVLPLLVTISSPALAQDNDETGSPEGAQAATGASSGQIQEIVVTAQRRAENLQDVPVAITAISGADLVGKGIVSTSDLAQVTPGLNFTTAIGTAVPRIRGIGTSAPVGGNENPIATYVDGVYIASAAAAIFSLSNIEQVAVLKGPQGTLFGRNATGGLVQVTTRDPEETFGGDASFTYGNKNRHGGSLYLTGGLAAGVAADIAVYYMNQPDGYGTNLFNGEDVGSNEEFLIRSKLKARLGDRTDVTLVGDYAKINGAFPALRPVDGTIPRNGVPFTGGKFDINADAHPSYRSEQGGVSLSIKHEFDFADLVSVSAYRKSKFVTFFDNDRTTAPSVNVRLESPDEQFSQEVQLVSNSGSGLNWVLGAYYFDASSGFQPFRLFQSFATIWLDTTQKTSSFAAFAQATYELSETTNLTAGLRWTTEERKFKARSAFQPIGAPLNYSPFTQDSLTNRKLTWRLALDHELARDTLAYISYNRGFKSGGFNPGAVADPPFDPEVLDAFEVGLKTDFFNRTVRLNTAAFYYEYKNIQSASFSDGVQRIQNATSARIYGLDLDGVIAPARDLTINFGLSLLHHRFGDFPGAVISVPIVPDGVVLGGNIMDIGNAEGNRLPNTPDWTANIGANYVIPLATTGSVEFYANYFHSDGFFGEVDNRLRQRPYDLLNASVTWFSDDSKSFSIKLWGTNLTNVAHAVQFAATTDADAVAMASGRAFGVTAGVRF